jgi:hypothetical protein
MKKMKFCWIIIFPLLISCHYLFPTSSKEIAPKESTLAGTWKLINFEGTDPAGRIHHPLGDRVIGQMQLDTSGRFTIQLMDAGRPSLTYNDPYYAPDNQIRMAFLGYTGYYGTYLVDKNKRLLILQVEGASLPNWIGKEQIRGFHLNGDSLYLSRSTTRVNGINMRQVSFWLREQD